MLIGYSVPYNNVEDDQNSYGKKFLKSAQDYTVFQKKWRQNSNHYNYGIPYQN